MSNKSGFAECSPRVSLTVSSLWAAPSFRKEMLQDTRHPDGLHQGPFFTLCRFVISPNQRELAIFGNVPQQMNAIGPLRCKVPYSNANSLNLGSVSSCTPSFRDYEAKKA